LRWTGEVGHEDCLLHNHNNHYPKRLKTIE
jgi:hypothetical protein